MGTKQNDHPHREENRQPDLNGAKFRRMLGDWGQRAWGGVQKVLSKGQTFFARLWETVKIKGDIQRAFAHLRPRRIAVLVLVVLLGLYLASGSYVVNPGEEAVERLFGRVVKEGITEGLHYRLPWPFQQVDKVNVSEIQREGIGLLLPEHRGVHSSPNKIQILTGDENIVDVQMVIQYRITDPAKYLFKVDYRPYQIINEVVRYAVTRIGSSMLVDEILTIAKEEIQRMVQAEVQRLLDAFESGLSVITVNINRMYPPDEVADAFRDVASAREDRSRTINQAEGYRNSLIPPAKGEAERMIREAEGYKAEVINRAQGDTQRFLQMLAEYRRSGSSTSLDVTLERLYLETMEKILPRMKKYILNSNSEGKMNLRFFEATRD
ncbi:MAG: FtsH protease activity modulator HflK [Candidatus Zixiibacteriota bacterium]